MYPWVKNSITHLTLIKIQYPSFWKIWANCWHVCAARCFNTKNSQLIIVLIVIEIHTLVGPKPSLEIGTANAICWNSLCLFRDYGLNHTFLGLNLFLFFKIISWNLKHLFEKEFREISQNFNSIRQRIQKMEIEIVWMSWNFVRFHKILFQTDAESFSFYLEKQKSFIPKQIWSEP